MFQYSPMTTTALLIGGECTGKSALARAVATRLTDRPVTVVPEVVRAFVVRQGRAPTQDEQEGIWQEQTDLLEAAIARSPASGLVICDPAPVMTAVYSIQYFDDFTLLPAALDAANTSDLVVWCAPDIPWEHDGIQRDGPQARARTHDLLTELVVPGLDPNRIVSVSGPVDDRVQQLLSRLT